MNPRLLLANLVLLVFFCAAPPTHGQGKLDKKLTPAETQGILNSQIDVKGFAELTKARKAFEILSDKTSTKNKTLSILIDQKSFNAEELKIPDLESVEVMIPPLAGPQKMTVRTALYVMVNQLHPNATFIVQPGGIEITTWTKAKASKAQIAYPMPVKPAGELLTALNTVIDTKELQKPIKLAVAMELLADQFAGKKKPYPVVLIHWGSFGRDNPNAPDAREIQVKLPAQKMTLGNALQALVTQADKKGIVVTRQGFIELTMPERQRLAPAK